MDGSDLSTLEDLCRLANVRRGAVLGAGLQHSLVTPHGLHHFLSLTYAMSQRLFDVHIFTRLAGQYGDGCVPVVGSRHQDGVDVLLFEQPSEVAIGAASRSGPGFCSRLVRLVNIAHGCEFHISYPGSHKVGERSPSSATSNQGDVQSIIRT